MAWASSTGSSTVVMRGTRSARSRWWRAMRSRISSSHACAVAMYTARCCGDCASQAAASDSARAVLPLFWPPRINSLRATRRSAMVFAPLGDDAMQLVDAIGQGRRPGLQDVGGLDLEQLTILHRIDALPTRPRRDLLGPEFLATPGADDDV